MSQTKRGKTEGGKMGRRIDRKLVRESNYLKLRVSTMKNRKTD